MSDLTIIERQVDGVVFVDLDGKILLGESNRQLHDAVRLLVQEGKKNVVLNLESVTRIDSSGLGELIASFATLEKNGGAASMSASCAATVRGELPCGVVLTSCSNSRMRQALTPGVPVSRTIVARSPRRRALATMLSSVKPTDMASNPSLDAIASMHSRVRNAVLPDRIMAAPSRSCTSRMSASSGDARASSLCNDEVMLVQARSAAFLNAIAA